MRYSFFFLFAIALTILGCGSLHQETEPAEPSDAGIDADAGGSCTVGESCAEMTGCACHVIDDCGCIPGSPGCSYYTCVSDADGSECLAGRECAAGHCAMVPFLPGQACGDGGACDGTGICVNAPDAGSCACSPLATTPTIYYSDSNCTTRLLVIQGSADGGPIGVACANGAAWDVSGTIDPATLAPLLKTPQTWWFMHGVQCEAQQSALDIGLVAGDVVAVGTVRAPCN